MSEAEFRSDAGDDFAEHLVDDLQVADLVWSASTRATGAASSELSGAIDLSIGGQQPELRVSREILAKEYARGQGWNPDVLTPEQILEIRAQPAWRRPLTDAND